MADTEKGFHNWKNKIAMIFRNVWNIRVYILLSGEKFNQNIGLIWPFLTGYLHFQHKLLLPSFDGKAFLGTSISWTLIVIPVLWVLSSLGTVCLDISYKDSSKQAWCSFNQVKSLGDLGLYWLILVDLAWSWMILISLEWS